MNFYGAQYSPDVLREVVALELRAAGLQVAVTLPRDLPQHWALLARGAFGTRPHLVKALADSIAEKAAVDAVSVHQTRWGLIIALAKPPALRRTLAPREVVAAVLRERPSLSPLRVPVGLDLLGAPVLLDLADPASPHLAILGATGSGKSEVARWLLWWLSFRNGDRVWLVAYSPKPDYTDFAGCVSFAHPPIQDAGEALRLLAWLVAELDRRMAAGESTPPLVALFDEVPTLLEVSPGADALLSRLAAAGRAVGVHLVIGSQQAAKDAGSGAMANMPARLVGRVASGTLAYVTSGKSGTEADKLLGRGDFLLVRHDAVRLQAPLLGAEEMRRLARGPARALALPDLVAMPERPRGGSGWNATPVDEAEILAAFAEGASLREVMERFRIGFARAKRLQEQFEIAWR